MMRRLIQILFILIILQFRFTDTAASDHKGPAETEKSTAVEMDGEAPDDKPERASGHCKSEVDRKVCATLKEAIIMYYQISNHVPVGYYERKYEMNRLVNEVETARESMTAEFGYSDSMDMVAVFVDFVKFKEKAELLFAKQEYSEADENRKTAYKNHDKITDYCQSCIEGFE